MNTVSGSNVIKLCFFAFDAPAKYKVDFLSFARIFKLAISWFVRPKTTQVNPLKGLPLSAPC